MDENTHKFNQENTQNSTHTQSSNINFHISNEDIKKESTKTINQVKETLKNTNLKKDSQIAKGFFSSFFKNPLEELKVVAIDDKASFLKIAVIILVIWLATILVSHFSTIAGTYLFGPFGSFEYFFKNLFSNLLLLIKSFISPILSITILSGLVYGFMKNKNKSFISIVSTIVIAKIPVVIACVVSLLTILGNSISNLTIHFSDFANTLSTILLFFAIKNLSDETQNKSYFWKFVLMIGIFYAIKFVFSYLGIFL